MKTSLPKDYAIVEQTQSLIPQLLDVLRDEHLDFTLGGQNPNLRTLFLDLAWYEEQYTASFRDFSFNHAPGVSTLDAGSVESLLVGFQRLRAEMREAVSAISVDDWTNRLIYRGEYFQIPPSIQIQIYREAILIFCAKASVYLRCLDLPSSEQWGDWIG